MEEGHLGTIWDTSQVRYPRRELSTTSQFYFLFLSFPRQLWPIHDTGTPILETVLQIYLHIMVGGGGGVNWEQFKTLPRYHIPWETFRLNVNFIVYISNFQMGYDYFTIPIPPYQWLCCKYLFTLWWGWVNWEQFETCSIFPIPGGSFLQNKLFYCIYF